MQMSQKRVAYKGARPAISFQSSSSKLQLENLKENGTIGAKRRHQQLLMDLQVKKAKLQTTRTGAGFMDDVVVSFDTEQKIKQIDEEVQRLEAMDPVAKWFERVQHLKSDIGTLAILNFVSGTTARFTIDADRHECGRPYKFNSTEYLNTCRYCKECVPVLIAAEDQHCDVVCPLPPTRAQILAQGKIQTEKKQKLREKLSKRTKAEPLAVPQSPSTPPDVTSPTASAKLMQAKQQLYNMFLQQFAEDAIEIPFHVFAVVSETFAENIHLLRSKKKNSARPPLDVGKVLKDQNLKHYIPHAMRITKLYYGEPMPVLSSVLMQRLRERWEDVYRSIVNQATYNGNSIKINNQMFTYFALVSEGRPDLASAFVNEKNNPGSLHGKRLRLTLQNYTGKFTWKL